MSNASTEKAIFQAVLFISDPDERAEYLEVACQDDAELRRRVEALLASSENPVFMRQQAMESVIERAPDSKFPPTGLDVDEQSAVIRPGYAHHLGSHSPDRSLQERVIDAQQTGRPGPRTPRASCSARLLCSVGGNAPQLSIERPRR